jgi:hypothetical protein
MALSLHQWATAVLKSLHVPVTPANVDWLSGWALVEATKAKNNPLATTQAARGATNFNSVGVKNYPTQAAGIAATARTLKQYPAIVAAFQTGSITADSFSNPAGLVEAFSVWSGNKNNPTAGIAYFNAIKVRAQGSTSGSLSASDALSYVGGDLDNSTAAAPSSVGSGILSGVTSWITGSAGYALTWLGLVLFAVVLGLVGLLKLVGVSPGAVLRNGTKTAAAVA